MDIKTKLHELIETITDEHRLTGYYALLSSLNNTQDGQLFNSLSIQQREELLLSYDESFADTDLIEDREVKEKHSKWL